jgi:hypothetical protein
MAAREVTSPRLPFVHKKFLRNLRDAHGLDDRRTSLTLGEAIGFFLVGVNTAEFFAIGVVDGNHKVMMAAALVLDKWGLAMFDLALIF